VSSDAFSRLPSAQTPSTAQDQAPLTFKVTTKIVLLDVVVTDKKGNLITQPLTKDDFTIVEDKQVQQIRSFEPPSAHRMPQSDIPIVNSAADLGKIGDSPVTILVSDELNSRFEDMSYSRQMMVKYLQTQPKILKEPTVLLAAENSSFKQLHDYTQDRDALIDVIKKHMPEFPYKMSGASGPGAVERLAQTMAALQQIAQASTGTPGRKNLIWVGNGFPASDLVTLDSDTAATIEAAYRRITIRLLNARVTMYTINPSPGSSATVTPESVDDVDAALDANGSSPFDQGSVSFSSMATASGGIAYQGRNDINNIIGEGIDKGQNYYTLSYSPTGNSTDAAMYRNITVVMKDKSMVATTRKGYFPETAGDLNPTMDTTMKVKQATANVELDLSAALTSTISYNGLKVTAEKGDAGKYTIRVSGNGIGWMDTDNTGAQHEEATVAAAWYDAKGKIIGHAMREQVYIRSAVSDAATFNLPVTLPPNAVRMRFVVRDASNGRMGTFDIAKP
jgi:VWFA-related protein